MRREGRLKPCSKENGVNAIFVAAGKLGWGCKLEREHVNRWLMGIPSQISHELQPLLKNDLRKQQIFGLNKYDIIVIRRALGMLLQ